MSTASEVVARVSRLAAGQWGMLTTAQAEREGISRLQLARLADAGVLERVDRGVYATTSSGDEHRMLRAAWLALDPARTAEERLADLLTAGVVSHTSAAGLHRLGDLLDDRPEITLPYRKQTRRGIRVHRRELTVDEVTLVEGLPTTTEERTVADLLRDGHDPEHIAQIIGQGVRRGVIDLDDLAMRIDPSARRHGQPDGHALVEHLLDLVGLSPAALTRDLAKTAAGQGLVAAGRASALNDILASIAPKLDLPQPAGLDAGRLGLDTIVRDLHAAPHLAHQIDEITKSLFPSVRSVIADMQSPAVQSAIASANSSGMRALLAQMQSPALQAVIEAANSSAFRAAVEGARSPATMAGPARLRSTDEMPVIDTDEPASERDETENST